jgi:hypothetical protein
MVAVMTGSRTYADVTSPTTNEQGTNAEEEEDPNELEFDDGIWMASVPEHPTRTTSDPAPVTPIETIAARTDEMWVVEVTDPVTYASIGEVLSVIKKETVDTMGPSEGNWRKGTTTSEETNLDLESTEYFECMLVPLECSELTCVTPTDWSMVGRSELTCATLVEKNLERSKGWTV